MTRVLVVGDQLQVVSSLLKVAIIHDWLLNMGGAERVLFELHNIFPEAPIYTLFCRPSFIKEHLPDADIRVSRLNSVPGILKYYRYYLPLMPIMIESFDLADFDVVISSSVFFSKGVVTRPKTFHISYCYSPARPLWDRNTEYEHKSWPAFLSRHFLRVWDRHAAQRVDKFVAISQTIHDRIKKYYGRDSDIIFPPLTLAAEPIAYNLKPKTSDFYLLVSRLVPHKNVDVAIDAFNKLGYNLVIVGNGPIMKYLKNSAKGNVKLIGYANDHELIEYYKNCKALIMPQEEDFGLTPVEAMSYGKPVIALRRGGAMEIIKEGINGEFFDDAIPEALADGVRRLNKNAPSYDSQTITDSVKQFDRKIFKDSILKIINENIDNNGQLQ